VDAAAGEEGKGKMTKRIFIHVNSGPFGSEDTYPRLSAVPFWARERALVVDIDVPNKLERTVSVEEPRGRDWTFEKPTEDGLSSVWVRPRRVRPSRRAGRDHQPR
jgi:hypothetical protein